MILEVYDTMRMSIRTGRPHETCPGRPSVDLRCCKPPLPLGILAYGSLIQEPGPEIEPHICLRIATETPFRVEYARLSRTRGGAPTLAPHPAGALVKAQILVLDDTLSVEEARDRLWRRETRTMDPTQAYIVGNSADSIRVELATLPSCATILYTDYNPSGKIERPIPDLLAQAAMASVARAAPAKDGITYLGNAIAAGTKTPLTDDYTDAILRRTGTGSLGDALATLLADVKQTSARDLG